MTGRQGGGLRLGLRWRLFLRNPILLDLAPVTSGHGPQQNEKRPSCAGWVSLGARQKAHLKYLQVFDMKRKPVVRGMFVVCARTPPRALRPR